MHSLSPHQIKAARGLLDWSQDDLAGAANVSLSTIRSFESGVIPRKSSIILIYKALDERGIEFTDGDGVKRRDEIKIYRGPDSCEKFLDDVRREIRDKEPTVLALIKSQDVSPRLPQSVQAAFTALMDGLADQAELKCLLSDQAKTSGLSIGGEGRILARPNDGPSSFFVYGHKYGFVYLDSRMNFVFTVFNIPSLAASYRHHFLALWEQSLPPALRDSYSSVRSANR